MEEKLVELLIGFYEKQDIVQQRLIKNTIDGYGYSDLHCIDTIGTYDKVNVQYIADKLSVTRGAASKITKRLLLRGDISSYQLESSQKKIYFQLTETGKEIFETHKLRHDIWKEQEKRFYKSIPEEEMQVVCNFFEKYNQYLEDKVIEMEEEEGPE